MMVPRSYSYGTSAKATVTSLNQKDSSVTRVERKPAKAVTKKKETPKTAKVASGFSPSPSAPSKPVVIPTRTKRDGRRRHKAEESAMEELEKDTLRRDPPVGHVRSSLSPSAAALLAMTTIQTPKRHMPPARRRVAREDERRRAEQDDRFERSRQSLSSSSPRMWNVLLSPPLDLETDSDSVDGDAGPRRTSCARSVSSESMPSLEEDDESIYSASGPATPAMASSHRNGRKSSLSTSKGEDCALDHPLLPQPVQPIETIPEHQELHEVDVIEPRSTPTPIRSTFKSNLTASLRAVRSAARSISTFTTSQASVPPDDLLSESLLSLSLPYTVERRPPPSSETPDPALRRYLNPFPLSPSELHFHGDTGDAFAIKASIQLQTCQRGARHSEHASAPPIFMARQSAQPQPFGQGRNALDTEGALNSSSSPRQREPRENADFLRMIVLEMNMRKCGKLSRTHPGRAKLWLPARQVEKTPSSVTAGAVGPSGSRGDDSPLGVKRENVEGFRKQDESSSDMDTGPSGHAKWGYSRRSSFEATGIRQRSVPARWTAVTP